MNAPVSRQFSAGDVLRYLPERRHAREGTAVVLDNGRAVDTYWHSYRSDSMAHVLTADELATAEVEFNRNDVEALDEYEYASGRGVREKWKTYHLADRARITSQHGLQEALFIRKGAEPDLTTQIANAQAKVEKAESEVRSAEHRLEWAREDLAKIQEQAIAS